ncbi:MAG: AI-2E family transporter [Acidobacteriota bacterium]
MADKKQVETTEIVSEQVPTEPAPQLAITHVHLDPSTPSIRSIVRIVVITLLILFIAGSVQAIVSSIASLFFLIILSIFLAYLIDPLVKIIRRPFKARGVERFMPRFLAVAVSYLIVLLVLGLAIAYIAPRVIDQAKEFGTNLPAFGTALRTRANEINQRFDRLRVPDEVQAEINKKVTDLGSSVTEAVGNFLLISVTYLPWFLLVPILAFFFLKDFNLFRLAVLRMFPAGPLRMRAETVMADVNTTLAAYVRAQLISCVIIALICITGFSILGLKYALLLGILAGIFEFVPLLGPLTIGLIVIATAAASDHPWNALYVTIFLVVLRVIHDYVTYPRIVRGGIHMHPLAIILSVLAGEQVAGSPGVFISIPIVAVATVIYRNILEHQGKRSLISGWIELEAELEAEEDAA